MLRKPPKDTTAYATRPVRGSITSSLMVPRLSFAGFTTFVPMTLEAFTGELVNSSCWVIVVLQGMRQG